VTNVRWRFFYLCDQHGHLLPPRFGPAAVQPQLIQLPALSRQVPPPHRKQGFRRGLAVAVRKFTIICGLVPVPQRVVRSVAWSPDRGGPALDHGHLEHLAGNAPGFLGTKALRRLFIKTSGRRSTIASRKPPLIAGETADPSKPPCQ